MKFFLEDSWVYLAQADNNPGKKKKVVLYLIKLLKCL